MGCNSRAGTHPTPPSGRRLPARAQAEGERSLEGTGARLRTGKRQRTKETKVLWAGGATKARWLPVWLGLTSLAVPKVRAEEKARAPLSPGIAAGLPVLR